MWRGSGRSVLIDKDNRLVGGNKAQKGFKAAGKKKVIIVDSDADTLVAVRRKDVSLDSAEGSKMAYLDNLTTQVNLTWDETELEAVQADVEGFDIADFGFDIEDLPQVTFHTGEKQGEGSQQKDPTNSELDVDGFGDKIKMVLELSIEEHAFIQQRLSQDGMTKEQVLLNLLGYAEQ